MPWSPQVGCPGYFEVPTDEGWRITLQLAEGRLELADAWGMNSGEGGGR